MSPLPTPRLDSGCRIALPPTWSLFRSRTAARVLDLQGQFFALSGVAAQILQETLEVGPEAAVRSIAERWGVDAERVRADLDKFVLELLRQGLLVPRDEPVRRPRLRDRLAGSVVSALTLLTLNLRPSLQGKAAGLLSLANLSSRWLGWAKTVRLWQRLFAKPERAADGPAAELLRLAIDDAVRKALAHSALSHACKERGLTSWALGRRAGLAPQLFIGLSLYPLHGHCWAQLDTICLGDDPERCAQYEPVLIYQ